MLLLVIRDNLLFVTVVTVRDNYCCHYDEVRDSNYCHRSTSLVPQAQPDDGEIIDIQFTKLFIRSYTIYYIWYTSPLSYYRSKVQR